MNKYERIIASKHFTEEDVQQVASVVVPPNFKSLHSK